MNELDPKLKVDLFTLIFEHYLRGISVRFLISKIHTDVYYAFDLINEELYVVSFWNPKIAYLGHKEKKEWMNELDHINFAEYGCLID